VIDRKGIDDEGFAALPPSSAVRLCLTVAALFEKHAARLSLAVWNFSSPKR
jgi:hypothetical protein